MPTANEVLTIQNLKGGEVAGKINAALAKVSDNICDINADPKAKREVNIKLVFKPAEGSDVVSVEANVTPKLAGSVPAKTAIVVGKAGGKAEAHEIITEKFKQGTLLSMKGGKTQ